MIKHAVEQGSDEWLRLRAGIPTASEFGALVTPLWKAREGDGVGTYLTKKLAERWLGSPLMTFSGGSMEQGSIREAEAKPFYEFTTGDLIESVGFVTTDDGRIGCSPDGLLNGGGIEIKCPEPHTHVRYLIDGELPKEYAPQVYGSMLVTGAPRWKFMSYSRNFPPLVLTIERDEKIICAIRGAVEAFNEILDRAWAKLVEINGGDEPVRTVQRKPRKVADPFAAVTLDQELLREWMAQ